MSHDQQRGDTSRVYQRGDTSRVQQRSDTSRFEQRSDTGRISHGRNPRFLTLLVERGVLTTVQAAECARIQRNDALLCLEGLIKQRPEAHDELCRIYGDSLGIAWIDLGRTLFQPEIVRLLPAEFAKRHRMICIFSFGGEITAACADPTNRLVLEEAAHLIGHPVSAVFARASEIADALAVEGADPTTLANLGGQLDLDQMLGDEDEITPEGLRRLAGNEGVVQFTRNLLLLAVRERASDIHIEPGQSQMRIRLRIDGALQERLVLSLKLLQPVVSCLKVMAGCDIIEKRRPQDGRITLALASRSIDLRFSCVPGLCGEKLVLRVLGNSTERSIPDLGELGLSARHSTELRRLLSTPNGVFFVTGPTGSGKTTTLFSCLKHLNRPDINVMTIEDPVEYRLPGINQVQVNHEINLTFATALRAFLRQDPNIILVGEVRDMETAKIASQAALTGHLVMSTMHTNNALQAVTRLVEIGVEPFLVAPSIIGVMAQRLVRRLCPACRYSEPMEPRQIERLFGDVGDREILQWHAKGCEACRGSGFSGRVAIHEIFVLNDPIRSLIARNASILDIQQLAKDHGFRPMFHDGLKKALRGLTTLEELERVIAASA